MNYVLIKGHIGVQWAKQRGCYVIGTTSSTEKQKLLKELGCDRVINYREENIDEVLTKEFPVSFPNYRLNTLENKT